MNHKDGLYLCPMPQTIPVKDFSGVTVETCLVDNPLDELVYGHLIKLYGFKRDFIE